MNEPVSLRFETKLNVSANQIWVWITSIQGITTELRPMLWMSSPKDVHSLLDLPITQGVRLFRSYVFLFGWILIDYSDMTLVEFQPGQGFVEQSPMASMHLWRHERRIVLCREKTNAVKLVDVLTFQPRFAKRFIVWFVRRLFMHRHHVLKKNFG